MANGLKALGSYLADDTLSDEALNFVADPYADRVTRIQRSGQSSPELQAFLARADAAQEQRDAERAVEAAARLPQVKAREDIPQESVPPLLRRTEGMEPRVSSVSAPSNLGVNSFLRQLAASRPSSEAQPSRQPSSSDPVVALESPTGGVRRPVDPSSTKAVAASPQKTMFPGVLASPIPIASAPVKVDVPAAVAGTIAPTTSTSSAPPAGGQTEPDLSLIPTENPRAATTGDGSSPAVRAETAQRSTDVAASAPSVPASDGSGGDDEMASLRRRLGLLQAFEGVGSAASGKNLRTDGGILVDRMKQIEALRAKREEQTLEQQRERSTWGASNRATLASALAQWKGDPERTAALEALASGADTTKPSDFSRNAVNAVMTKPKVLGVEATTGKTEAGTDTAKAKTKTEDLLREPKARKLGTAADLDEARIRALNAKSAADALALTKSRAAVADAGKAGTPSKEAIKYIRDDLKTAEKAITPTLENFKAIESVSPGFAFGRPDKQLETLEFVTASKLPRFAKQASDLRSAVEALIIDIRHGSFGASLTATEKASFESMLNTGLSGTVGQLSKAVDRVRRKAAATAQTHFNTSQQFYPTETQQVLSTSAVFGPATRKGGVYADVWTLPEAPAAGGGAATRQQKPTASEGYTTFWNKAQGKWQEIPNEKAEAAKASGRFEE
jgi:hypothetical protein